MHLFLEGKLNYFTFEIIFWDAMIQHILINLSTVVKNMKTELTIKEVASELGIHWQTVKNYIERNELKAHKVGKYLRILRKDLDFFISASRQTDKTIEVELRYKVHNINVIRKKLIDLGARLTDQSHIIDHWFIPIDIMTYKQQVVWFDVKRNTGMRIREYRNDSNSKLSSVTLDTKRLTLALNHNTFIETSMKVESYEKAKKFIEMIDRKEFLTIDKIRLLYKYDQFTFSIDTIKDYGSGVEIEYIGKPDSRSKILSEIESLAKKLGLKNSDKFDKSLTVDAMEKLARY